MQNLVNAHSQASTLFAKAHVPGAQKDAALGENGEPIDFAALLAAGMPGQADGLDARLATIAKSSGAKIDAALEPGTATDMARDATSLDDRADPTQTVAQMMPADVLAHLLTRPAAVTPPSPAPAADGMAVGNPPTDRTKPDARMTDAPSAHATPNNPATGREAERLQADDRSASAAPALPSSTFSIGSPAPTSESSRRFDTAATAGATAQAATPVAPDALSVVPSPAATMHGSEAHTAANAVTPPPMQAAIGSLQWDTELSQRVVWSVNQRSQIAEIHVTPPELGPIAMTLSLDAQTSGQQASIHFVSAHAPVREAIEAALPRLREMMADAGIALGNATVSSESFQQPADQNAQRQPGNRPTHGGTRNFAIDTSIARDTPRGRGLVDLFA